jgi:hypothetical protein
MTSVILMITGLCVAEDENRKNERIEIRTKG